MEFVCIIVEDFVMKMTINLVKCGINFAVKKSYVLMIVDKILNYIFLVVVCKICKIETINYMK